MGDAILSQTIRHFAPVSARVLGEELGAFTLWHWQQLAVIGSPYATLDYGHGFADLSAAVQVCASPPLTRVSFRLNWWQRAIWKLKAWRFGDIPRLVDEEQTFFDWLTYQLVPPAKWTKGGGQSLQCPAWLYIAGGLIDRGIDPDAVWSMPVGEARCYLAAIAVANGGGDFLTDEEVERMVEQGAATLEDFGLA